MVEDSLYCLICYVIFSPPMLVVTFHVLVIISLFVPSMALAQRFPFLFVFEESYYVVILLYY